MEEIISVAFGSLFTFVMGYEFCLRNKPKYDAFMKADDASKALKGLDLAELVAGDFLRCLALLLVLMGCVWKLFSLDLLTMARICFIPAVLLAAVAAGRIYFKHRRHYKDLTELLRD